MDIIDWRVADRELRRLAKCRAAHDFEEAGWLVAAYRADVHGQLGMSDFFEYLDLVFGYGFRKGSERLRVAEEIETLTEIGAALRDGVLSWSAVREITRVAVVETQRDWIEAARGRRIRDVERLVAGRERGDRPSDPARDEARRHVLRFEVSAETYATVREAIARIKRESDGAAIADDDVLLLMARAALGGPKDDGRASYQVAISVCPECNHTEQDGRGECVVIDDDVAEMAHCDAQYVHLDQHEQATQTIPPATRRLVMRRDHRRCAVPGCTNAVFVDVHHTDLLSEGGDHDTDKLICLCGAHHRAVHKGRLLITGKYSTGFICRHADGTRYGGEVSAEKAKLFSDAFSMLKELGFQEGASRRTLDEFRTHVGRQ